MQMDIESALKGSKSEERAIVEDYNDYNEEEEDGQYSEKEITAGAAAETPEIHCAVVYLQAQKSKQGGRLTRINLKDYCLSC